MKIKDIFDALWHDHLTLNPAAGRIQALLESLGENVVNDHVAFRTFAYPHIGKHAMARHFLERGYMLHEELDIPEKSVTAWHLEPTEQGLPKVFISELHAERVSTNLARVIDSIAAQIPEDYMDDPSALWSGRPWRPIKHTSYTDMCELSEYAAWMAVHGYHANHFTYAVHAMHLTKDIREVNRVLTSKGYVLNASGGEVKGTPDELLEQSSTMASVVHAEFIDGMFDVPGCYTEFAKRYPDATGELFKGFIPASANKIFESTDAKPR